MDKKFLLQVDCKNPNCGKPIAINGSAYNSFDEAKRSLLSLVKETTPKQDRPTWPLLPCRKCGQARFYRVEEIYIQEPKDEFVGVESVEWPQ